MMWALIFLAFIIITIFALVFLWRHIGKFKTVKKLANGKKWKKRLITFVPFAAILIYIIMDTVTAIISVTHLVIIWLVVEFIFKLLPFFKELRKKVYIEGGIALTITTVYLVIAYIIAVTVVPVDYKIDSDKVNDGKKLRVVMFADSHIGSTFDGEKLAEYIHDMGKLNPDILVIVGDYVDDDSKKVDMLAATKALGEIETTYGVYYVFGNHDKGYYNSRDFNEQDLRNALTDAGVTILEDEAVSLNDSFNLVGRQDRSEPDRAEIAEIMQSVDKDKYTIVLNHQPNDQKAEMEAGADLVLSGHTHGGQLLPINYIGEWTGLNDQTKGIRIRDTITYIVTSGISDWAIPFKTGCKAEYLIIDIE